MNAYMLAINLAYGQKDERSFVRKRLVALEMVFAIGFAFVLVAVLLIFGPQIEKTISSHLGAAGGVLDVVWWIVQVPILLVGLLARVCDAPLPRARRTRAQVEISHSRLARRRTDVDRDLRALRRLHLDVRLVQQDLGHALRGDRHAYVAVALSDVRCSTAPR